MPPHPGLENLSGNDRSKSPATLGTGTLFSSTTVTRKLAPTTRGASGNSQPLNRVILSSGKQMIPIRFGLTTPATNHTKEFHSATQRQGKTKQAIRTLAVLPRLASFPVRHSTSRTKSSTRWPRQTVAPAFPTTFGGVTRIAKQFSHISKTAHTLGPFFLFRLKTERI